MTISIKEYELKISEMSESQINLYSTVLTLYPNIMLMLVSCTSSLLCKSFKELFLQTPGHPKGSEPTFVPESECKSTAFIFNNQENPEKNLNIFSNHHSLKTTNGKNMIN